MLDFGAVFRAASMDFNIVYRRIKYAEWASVIVSAILQLTWVTSIHRFDASQVTSLSLLAGLLITASLPVEKMAAGQRCALMVAEILLATAAMTFGSYRLYGLIFLVIAGKTAIILEKQAMLYLAALIVVGHTLASYYVRGHYALIHGGSLSIDQHFMKTVLVEAQFFFVCAMIIAVMFGRTLLSESASRRAAERLSKEIEAMTQSVERARIARDMHDTIGHSLTSLNIQLELTGKLLESGEMAKAQESLLLARDAAQTSLADVRKTVRSIRDEEFSLEQSVQAMTERIGRQQKIDFDVRIDDSNLSPPCRHNLLMIMQECLTNVQRHSRASQVSIELDSSTRQARLTVKDNGVGFRKDMTGTGCGIKGMQERVVSLGGVLNIMSGPGEGTAITVVLPA